MDKAELITGYFEGSLSQDQLDVVKGLCKTDPSFAADFEFQKELQISLKKVERRELKNMFSELASENKKPQPATKVVQLRSWLAAASIALLVAIGSWFYFLSDAEINNDQLYASNFAPYENVVSPIERGTVSDDLRTRAFMAYENKEYAKSLKFFEQLKLEIDDSYIEFYEANVRMHLNQHTKAIPLLSAYIANGEQLADRATWYLALSHLKLGEIEKTKVQLNKLIKLGSFKTKAAKQLLIQLD